MNKFGELGELKLKEGERDNLLYVLNRRGAILEEKVFAILKNCATEAGGGSSLPVLRKIINYNGEPVEVDVVLDNGEKIFIFEAKKTEYSWVFLKDRNKPNHLYLIYGSEKGLRVKSRSTPDFVSVHSDLAVMIDKDGKLVKNTKKEFRTAYKDVQGAILQVLKETEAVISETDKDKFINRIFVPVIVTNANLILVEYDGEKIDDKGDLTKVKTLKNVGWLVYNIPRFIKWDDGKQKSFLVGNVPHTDTKEMKSVFIVNIRSLKEVLPHIEDQDIGRQY